MVTTRTGERDPVTCHMSIHYANDYHFDLFLGILIGYFTFKL